MRVNSHLDEPKPAAEVQVAVVFSYSQFVLEHLKTSPNHLFCWMNSLNNHKYSKKQGGDY